MSIHDLTRSAVLRIPRVRRFYEYAGELGRESAALHQECERLRREREALARDADALRREREALDPELDVLRAQCDTLRQEAETLRADGASMREELGALRPQVEGLCAEREDLRLQLYVARSDLQRSINSNDQMRRDLEAARDELGSLDRMRQDLEAARAGLANVDGMRQDLEAAHADLERIREENSQLHGQLTSLATPAPAPVTSAELERLHAQLLGKLYVLNYELGSTRRLLRAEVGNRAGLAGLRDSYLDLLENALTGRLYGDPSIAPWAPGYDPEIRAIGRDWPALAQTMIGTTRMRNIRALAESLIEDGIEGDFLEAGVWRGGACIYMRGILAAYDRTDRKVLVADSFAGLPPPDAERYPADAGDTHHTVADLAVSLDEVKANFTRYGLLDDQVVFLRGWFKDTLPAAPTRKLALLRLDGDMYGSTMDTLEATYYKVAPGGYIIIDDYILAGARQAVNDFRKQYSILEPMQEIDGAAVFWRKEA